MLKMTKELYAYIRRYPRQFSVGIFMLVVYSFFTVQTPESSVTPSTPLTVR